MLNHKHQRATKNLEMLKKVARKLGPLNNDVIYLGGCTTALLITDTLSLDVRPTNDVDCIVDIASYPKYQQFCKKLEQQGFKESQELICRWHHESDIILDIMPIDEKILGFGNHWYKEAIKNPVTHHLEKKLIIKSVNAPYLLATKIEAFKARGNKDFHASHDFEDIMTIIAGRVEISDEIAKENNKLRLYLKKFFTKINEDEKFKDALPGHVREEGPVALQRLATVNARIKKIIAN